MELLTGIVLERLVRLLLLPPILRQVLLLLYLEVLGALLRGARILLAVRATAGRVVALLCHALGQLLVHLLELIQAALGAIGDDISPIPDGDLADLDLRDPADRALHVALGACRHDDLAVHFVPSGDVVDEVLDLRR